MGKVGRDICFITKQWAILQHHYINILGRRQLLQQTGDAGPNVKSRNNVCSLEDGLKTGERQMGIFNLAFASYIALTPHWWLKKGFPAYAWDILSVYLQFKTGRQLVQVHPECCEGNNDLQLLKRCVDFVNMHIYGQEFTTTRVCNSRIWFLLVQPWQYVSVWGTEVHGMLRSRTRLVSVTILYSVLWCVRDHRLMSFLA